MKSEALFNELEKAGFILASEFDGDIHQPNYILNNENGEYVGDFLQARGFVKHEDPVKSGKTWVMFKKDNEVSFGHRKLSEYVTTSFFVIE